MLGNLGSFGWGMTARPAETNDSADTPEENEHIADSPNPVGIARFKRRGKPEKAERYWGDEEDHSHNTGPNWQGFHSQGKHNAQDESCKQSSNECQKDDVQDRPPFRSVIRGPSISRHTMG